MPKPTKTATYAGYRPADIDAAWLKDRLDAVGLSGRALGERMGIDATSIHRRLRGDMAFLLEEVDDLAVHLQVPLVELLKHLGLNVAASPKGATSVPLEGIAGEDGTIREASGVARVPHVGSGAAAIRLKMPSTPYDGWVAFYVPTKKVAPEAVGQVSVAGLINGDRYIGIISHGRERGTWDIAPLCGGKVVSGARLKWAAPVTDIRC